VERDICLIAIAQRPNCFYNKGYIAYFLLRMRETAIFPLPILGRFQFPTPSYSVVGADTLRDLVTLNFDLLTLNSGRSRGQHLHQVWRSYAYPFLTYELWCSP